MGSHNPEKHRSFRQRERHLHRDGDTAREFARRVEAGMVGINVPIPVPLAFYSFGGWKRSLLNENDHVTLADRDSRGRRFRHADHEVGRREEERRKIHPLSLGAYSPYEEGDPAGVIEREPTVSGRLPG